jgi:DNA ligase-1
MLLSSLVEGVGRVRATTRKTEKIALLADLLRPTRGRETELAALYLTGTLPQGRIGLGWRTLQSAATEAPRPGPRSGPPDERRGIHSRAADAERLTLFDVDRMCEAVAAERGAGSGERRMQALRALFARADAGERRFLVELLVGELRQGALEGLLLEAIARASGLPASSVRQAAMYSGNVGEVARAALEEGVAGLGRFSLRLLSPVAPMLASTADDVEAALERLGPAAFEYKLDGARIQLHKSGDEVRVFTRHLQDVTARVPEVVDFARALPVREAVLEGETIALRADGRPHPFQLTMSRIGRSKDVEAGRTAVPLSSFFFDCLFLEGEGSLVAVPYAERIERLARTVPAGAVLPRIHTGVADEAARFLGQALAAGHEGLMAKSLTAPYAAGHRGFHWLKLKSAHTLDLVILAVEQGSGRRRGWLSNLHLGARDPESGQFVMLGKTFKGLTDEMLRWQTEKLLSLEISRDELTVYVRPALVAEIAFSDVQESPRYPAGLALRFARVKAYRPDKPASEADTIQAVQEIFRRQRA